MWVYRCFWVVLVCWKCGILLLPVVLQHFQSVGHAQASTARHGWPPDHEFGFRGPGYQGFSQNLQVTMNTQQHRALTAQELLIFFSVSRILLTEIVELCLLSGRLRYFAVRAYPVRHSFIILSLYQLYLQYMLRWLLKLLSRQWGI